MSSDILLPPTLVLTSAGTFTSTITQCGRSKRYRTAEDKRAASMTKKDKRSKGAYYST